MRTNRRYKTGKFPARHLVGVAHFGDFVNTSLLPALPAEYLPPPISPWKMFKNDVLSCCGQSGKLHCQMVFDFKSGEQTDYDDSCVIKLYEEDADYVDGDPSTDNGTDMARAMLNWKSLGIPDVNGIRRKIDAFVKITKDTPDLLRHGVSLFNAAPTGFIFPESSSAWEDAFDNGGVWDGDIPLSADDSGHEAPTMGWSEELFKNSTWGGLISVTEAAIWQRCDEIYLPLYRKSIPTNIPGVDADKFFAYLDCFGKSVC